MIIKNYKKILIITVIIGTLACGCGNSKTDSVHSNYSQSNFQPTTDSEDAEIFKEEELEKLLFSKIDEYPDYSKHISSLHVTIIDSKDSNKISVGYILNYNTCLYMFGQETEFLTDIAYDVLKKDYEVSFILVSMTSETDSSLSKSFTTFNGVTGSYKNTSTDTSSYSSSNMLLSSLSKKDTVKIHAASYYTSKKAARYAKSAVEIAEKYLKGDISCSKALKQLDVLDNKTDYVLDMDESDENYSGDLLVAQCISELSIHIEVYEKDKYSDVDIKNNIQELKECY